MKAICILTASAVLLLSAEASLAAGSVDATGDTVAFRTTAKVKVDASGQPIEVTASTKLPQDVQGFIENEILSWRFAPAVVEGVAKGGTTYVALGGCAVPEQDGLKLALDYKGNGPALQGDADFLPPPRYPVDAIRSRSQASMAVSYVVQADGTAVLEDIRFDTVGKGGRKYFDAAIRDWVKTFRYHPEELDGRRVGTRLSTSVDFTVGTSVSRLGLTRELEKMRAKERAASRASPECIAAKSSQPASLSVTSESPFQLLSDGS
jgi:hypothetical protein